MKDLFFVCVGALYQDIILYVPHFPRENSKLRATARETRVGGNPSNLLRVLKQFIDETAEASQHLLLLCSVGEGAGDGLKLIRSVEKETGATIGYKLREGRAVSAAYIIESVDNNTRTIVSFNESPQLTRPELWELMVDCCGTRERTRELESSWLHFEGTNCREVLGFLTDLTPLSAIPGLSRCDTVTCSIDFEKWERDGLWELLGYADVGFFAEEYVRRAVSSLRNNDKNRVSAYRGHSSEAATKDQERGGDLKGSHEVVDHDDHDKLVKEFVWIVSPQMKSTAAGYIMAGEIGSYGFFRTAEGVPTRARFPLYSHELGAIDIGVKGFASAVPAQEVGYLRNPLFAEGLKIFWIPPCVIPEGEAIETTGAGDAFIAAVIYGLSRGLSVIQAGWMGNCIASRKCRQLGFDGVVEFESR